MREISDKSFFKKNSANFTIDALISNQESCQERNQINNSDKRLIFNEDNVSNLKLTPNKKLVKLHKVSGHTKTRDKCLLKNTINNGKNENTSTDTSHEQFITTKAQSTQSLTAINKSMLNNLKREVHSSRVDMKNYAQDKNFEEWDSLNVRLKNSVENSDKTALEQVNNSFSKEYCEIDKNNKLHLETNLISNFYSHGNSINSDGLSSDFQLSQQSITEHQLLLHQQQLLQNQHFRQRVISWMASQQQFYESKQAIPPHLTTYAQQQNIQQRIQQHLFSQFTTHPFPLDG